MHKILIKMCLFLSPLTALAIGHHSHVDDYMSNDQSLARIHVFGQSHNQQSPTTINQMGTGTLFSLVDQTDPRFIITAAHLFTDPDISPHVQSLNLSQSYVTFDGRTPERIKTVHRHPHTDLAIIELQKSQKSHKPTRLSFETPSPYTDSIVTGWGTHRKSMLTPVEIVSIQQTMRGTFMNMAQDPLESVVDNPLVQRHAPTSHFITSHYISNPLGHPFDAQALPENRSNGFILPGDSGGKIANARGEQYAVISIHRHESLPTAPMLNDDVSLGVLLFPYEQWIRTIVATT